MRFRIALIGSVVVIIVLPLILTMTPGAASGPTITSFTSSYNASTNVLTLAWATNSDGSAMPCGGSPAVYIFATNGSSIGCVDEQSGSTNVTITDTQRYTFTLEAGLNGSATYQQLSFDPPSLPPPTITYPTSSPNAGLTIYADPFDGDDINNPGQPPTITWSQQSGLYTKVNGGSASTATSQQVSPGNWQLRSCNGTSSSATCGSSVANVQVTVEGAQFQGNYRQFVPTGSTTVTWANPNPKGDTPGNFYFVSAPTLNNGTQEETALNQKSISIPTPSSGVVDVGLLTCFWNVYTNQIGCGPHQQTGVTVKVPSNLNPNGTLTLTNWLNSSGTPVSSYNQIAGEEVSYLTPVATVTDTYQGTQNSFVVTAGSQSFLDYPNPLVATGSTVSSKETIATLDSGASEELLVGSSPSSENANLLSDPWTSAFNVNNSTPYPEWLPGGIGDPGNPVFDSQGQVFFDAEFNNAMGEIDPNVSPTDSAVAALPVPLLQKPNTTAKTFTPVTPFANPLYGSGESTTSAIGDSAIGANGSVWFTQGGTGLGPSGAQQWNHSRIVSFNPSGPGDPSLTGTQYDSRYCVYSVPSNNNNADGLAWDGQRIWYAEPGTNSISWFYPDNLTSKTGLQCDSMLDYSTTDPNNPLWANGQHQNCASGVVPTTASNCVYNYALPNSAGEPGGIQQLQADPYSPIIWYTNFNSGYLGKVDYNPSTGAITDISEYPLPPPTSGIFSFPNSLAVDQNYVYVMEFGGADIVQFNKQDLQAAPVVIHLPRATTNVSGQDLQIYQGKLYFTLSGDAGLGYLTLSSLESGGSPSGVIYTGFSTLPDPDNADHNEAGMANLDTFSIDPATGNVAAGDFSRQQIVLLKQDPTTTVLVPSNAASVSGTQQVLDASAAANVGVGKVQFELSGNGYNGTPIATATLTYYGWIAEWNTTSVPDGTYSLQSVVTDDNGKTGVSDPITITVSN